MKKKTYRFPWDIPAISIDRPAVVEDEPASGHQPAQAPREEEV